MFCCGKGLPAGPVTKIPEVEVFGIKKFPPEKINIADHCTGKKVILHGMVAAFGGKWQAQVAGYLENQEALKEAGIEEVIIFSVNDFQIMKSWCEDNNANDSMLTFIADPFGNLTKGLKMENLSSKPPDLFGLIGRSKRFAMVVKDGQIESTQISYTEIDPLGAYDPSATCIKNILKVCNTLKAT